MSGLSPTQTQNHTIINLLLHEHAFALIFDFKHWDFKVIQTKLQIIYLFETLVMGVK